MRIRGDKDDIDVLEHWISLFCTEKIFPSNADYYRSYSMIDGFNYKIDVSWKINNDTNASVKQSVSIIIKIPQELFDDYMSSSQEKIKNADKKFIAFIKNKLRTDEPYHNHSKNNTAAMPVEWIVTYKDLLG